MPILSLLMDAINFLLHFSQMKVPKVIFVLLFLPTMIVHVFIGSLASIPQMEHLAIFAPLGGEQIYP